MKESLSTAGLLLLQQLSATERMVFFLREVLHYPFDEIAEIVGKSTLNCRQIYHRAKKGIGRLPDREPEAAGKKTALAERFAEALMSRNIGLLLELLASDAVLYMDGGGKVKAALRPIMGADRILRFFIGIADEIPAESRCEIGEINGAPGIRFVTGETTYAAVTFQASQDQLTNLYVVMNPEKLSHLHR